MITYYAFDDGIRVGADECGEANAYWNPSDRTLLLGYELVKDFQDLA